MAKQDIKVVEARRALDVVQSMIDISANRLEGLRTQCAPSAELTQHEIRTLEGKLVRLYSQMLVSKSKYLSEGTLPASDLKNIPSLRQWLQVVGLTPDAITGVCNRVTTLEGLQEKSDHELQGMLIEQQARDEDLRRLTKSLHNLRRYQELRGKCNHVDEINDTEPLHWDSWERNHSVQSLPTVGLSPRQPRTRTSRCSVPSEDFVPYNNNNYSYSTNSLAGSVTSSTSSSVNSLPLLGGGTPTHAPLSPPVQPVYPSSTPPSTPPVNKGKAGDRMKFKIFPTTPPPRRKHQTGIHSSPQQHQHNQIPQDQLAEELQNLESLQSIEQRQLQQQQLAQQVQNALGDSQTLTKSKSHESQLGNRVEGGDGNHAGGDGNGSNMNGPWPRRGRLPTEPGPDLGQTSPLLTSPIKSPPYNSTDSDDSSFKSGSLQVPKSPRTTSISRGVGHVIPHRFTKTFKMNTSCDLCSGSMFYGLKCKECKYKCHSNCAPKVPPSCGLSRELVDEFKKTLSAEGYMNQSPSMSRPSPSHIPNNLLRKDRKRTHPQPSIQVPPFQQGSDSTSNTSSCNSSTPSSPALIMQQHPSSAAPSTIQQSFNFPDVPSSQGITLNTHPLTAPPALEEILDSHKAQKEGVSMDSDKTISVSGSGSISTDSERTPVRVDSQDSQVSDGEAVENRGWPRQNSLSMREWDIPFDELNLGEPIGTGHFGTVFRGNWHGDVAIKVLNMDYMDDEKTIESFKLEVATFRKTRHENLVLFMGACMKPPRLAIVTSMCKGLTLYTHIHLRKDKFNMNRTTMVAQQISQGMGYLHARGIVHKDLKSKNIFLENGKVVITDFGLFSVTKLCFGNRKGDGLSIPPGWLCYLAPEIMCSLKANQKQGDEELPFSKASDVYAFGTVWYELLCGEWPFKAQPPEAIIWQVGKGMKQTLANLQASRDVKFAEKGKGKSHHHHRHTHHAKDNGHVSSAEDILMSCWSYKPEDRPDFIRLLKTLEKLPKKRLARSPSHPIHLSRSAESVF